MPADQEVAKDGHIEPCEPGDFVRFVGSVWRVEKDTLTVCVTAVNVVCKTVLIKHFKCFVDNCQISACCPRCI